MFLAIRCDAVPGKLQELDRWLKDRGVTFWGNKSGVKKCSIYADALVGYPERTLMIEVDDFGSLQKILISPEHARFRDELLTYGTDVQSQILERLV